MSDTLKFCSCIEMKIPMGYHRSFKTVTITRQKFKRSQNYFYKLANDSQITAKTFMIF